jgi:glycosyltransferase involved in cell wall biosynthesis
MSAIGHVQLFDVARSAHFERILRGRQSTTLLYARRRYDFDEGLARAVGARQTGGWGAAVYLMRNPVDVLEVTEPLALDGAPRALAAVIAVRCRRLMRRSVPRLVSYAIENKDPLETPPAVGLRSRVKRRLQWWCAKAVWRRLDRVAFGTAGAQQIYRRRMPATRAQTRLIHALPTPVAGPLESAPRPPVLVFLGEFSERKGFPLVLSAWGEIGRDAPDHRLVLIGTGIGAADAHALAAADGRVDVVVDPPRDRIFELLRSAKVLVLPSQPRPRWREQVGLPIVEGLGSGCEIVTTAETGLARWLSDHGHRVVQSDADPATLSRAVRAAMSGTRSPSDIVADLPDADGRDSAESWLLAAGSR